MERQIYLSLRSEFSDFLSAALLKLPGSEIIMARPKFMARSIGEYTDIAESKCQAAASLHWRLL
jgi:hypothetical protein